LQTSNVWGGPPGISTDPLKRGTVLIWVPPSSNPNQPQNWTAYRFSVIVESDPQAAVEQSAIGVVLRYHDSGHFYGFSMDRQLGCRRLVKVVGGVCTILAEDDFLYSAGRAYLITIEAVGESLRVYQDGALVFAVTDETLERGTIGLYCWRNPGARFSDVRVDDFRAGDAMQPGAPVPYRFAFTTSRYVNFFHHLHSFQDEIWPLELTAETLSDADLGQAAAATGAPADDESRAYNRLVSNPGIAPVVGQEPTGIRVTRLHRPADLCGRAAVLAFLVQSPEPIDWKRTELIISRADRPLPTGAVPAEVKLTGLAFGGMAPNEESVSVLLQDAVNLGRHRIEYRYLPGALAQASGGPVWFADDFDSPDQGRLFRETFGPNALDHYTIVPERAVWTASDTDISQLSGFTDGPVLSSAAEKPGTLAITGEGSWDNVRISAALRSEQTAGVPPAGSADIGLVFRYQDNDNYYRFSMSRYPGRAARPANGPFGISQQPDLLYSYRRLVKKVRGRFSVLWEDRATYNPGQIYSLEVDTYNDRLLGYLDNALMFSETDPDVAAGRVGFYTWGGVGAHFESLEVQSLDAPPVLWQPALTNLGDVEIVDDPAAVMGPSQWRAASGALTQISEIHREDTPGEVDRRGSYAIGGDAAWQDVQISVRLASTEPHDIGVMFRYQDAENYYRFSIDYQSERHRLIKRSGGRVTVLREGTGSYQLGQRYELTIRALGFELHGFVDGNYVFAAPDEDLKTGRMALYCWGNPGAVFERVVVTDATRRVGPWIVRDEEPFALVPSVWRRAGGVLRETMTFPTHAIAGDAAWTDYRLSVRLRSDDQGQAGILFRYADEENYYRFRLDAFGNERVLERIENGRTVSLWQGSGSYTVGEPFNLTVDAAGSRLVGYWNNTRLFDLTDAAHSTGRIGLFCFDSWDTRFERVEVRRAPLAVYELWRDRFGDGDTTAWTPSNPGADGVSSWSVQHGVWVQSGDIDTPAQGPDDVRRLGTQQAGGDAAWTDVIASVRVASTEGNPIGLLFRYSGEDHYYRFSLDRAAGHRRLIRNSGGNFALLWEDHNGYETDRAYEIAVMAVGSTLRGFVNGVPAFVVWDNDLAAGRIGLYCAGNRDAQFSQVRVYPGNRGFSSWLLEESFAYDALAAGRWSFTGDPEQSRWKLFAGRLYGGTYGEGRADDPPTYAVAGVADWTDYRVSVRLANVPLDLFRLAMGDALPPPGGVGGPGAPVPTAPLGFSLGRLITTVIQRLLRLVGRLPRLNVPAVGEIPAATVRPPAELPPREHVLNRIKELASSGAIGDSLVLRPAAGPVDAGIVGILVRYQDERNYCLFSMDLHRGRRRFLEKTVGTECVLWEDESPYETARDYIVTLDCVGPRFTAYLDGERLFDVTASNSSAGRVGLYCGPDSAASFREVRVGLPAWVNYYDFQTEERRPAGTRVMVHSGSASDAIPDGQVVEHRYAAALDDHGEIHLSADTADFRVLDAGQKSGHMRTFVSEADFHPLGGDIAAQQGLVALRKVDGTGFFLVRQQGDPIPAGQYRLNLTYRRDNRAVEAGSTVFRQAGSSEPEEVALDIPTIATAAAEGE
jgi:hypothetical protein